MGTRRAFLSLPAVIPVIGAIDWRSSQEKAGEEWVANTPSGVAGDAGYFEIATMPSMGRYQKLLWIGYTEDNFPIVKGVLYLGPREDGDVDAWISRYGTPWAYPLRVVIKKPDDSLTAAEVVRPLVTSLVREGLGLPTVFRES